MKKVIAFITSETFKYLVVIILFLLAMFLSSEHNIQTRIKNAITIRELQQEIDYYKGKSEKSVQRMQELESDKEDLEKFARERYRMHSPDEDVYVIEYE